MNKYRLIIESTEIIYRSKIIDIKADTEEEAIEAYRMEKDKAGVVIGNNEYARLPGQEAIVETFKR